MRKLGLAMLLALIMAWGCRVYYFPGWYEDDVVYLGVAHALEGARGLVDDSLAGSPPHSQYPPGYPLLLAPLWLFSPPTVYALARIQSVCFSLLSLLLIWRIGGRLGGLTALLLALNTSWAIHSSMVMSDVPYTAAVLLTLACWPTPEQGPRHWARFGAACALAAWLRVAGLTLVLPALGAMLLTRQRPRHWLAFGLAWLLLAGPIVALARHSAQVSLTYRKDAWLLSLLVGPSMVRENLLVSLNALGLVVAGNLSAALLSPAAPLGWLSLAVIGIGLAIRARRPGGAGLHQLLTALVVLVVPAFAVGFDFRFLLPLFPLALLAFLEGAQAIFRQPRALGLIFGLVALCETGVAASSVFFPPPQYRVATQTMQWLREHTSPSDRVASCRLMVWLYANRQVIRSASDSGGGLNYSVTFLEEWLEDIYAEKASWVLLYGANGPAQWSFLQASPNFQEVYRNPQEGTCVFRVVPGGAPFRRAFLQYEAACRAAREGRREEARARFHEAAPLLPAARAFELALSLPRPQAQAVLDQFLAQRPGHYQALWLRANLK